MPKVLPAPPVHSAQLRTRRRRSEAAVDRLVIGPTPEHIRDGLRFGATRALDAFWTALLRKLVALAIAASAPLGLTACGATGGMPSARQIENSVLHYVQIKVYGPLGWRFPRDYASRAMCIMPSAWTPGQTFECYVDESDGVELGLVLVTMQTSTNGSYDWTMSWVGQ